MTPKCNYNQRRVLHVTDGDRKFIPQLKALFDEHFEPGTHEFVVAHRSDSRKLEGLKFFGTKNYLSLLSFWDYARQFDKFVIHGLCDFALVKALWLLPLDYSEAYWVIWGGDIYCYNNRQRSLRSVYRNWVRRSLVRRIGHACSYLSKDLALARKWYGFAGSDHELIMYLSNTLPTGDFSPPIRKRGGRKWQVIVGNSGYDTNFHFELFDLIREQVGESTGKVFCPLSYGNQSYIDQVVDRGRSCFGDRFVPLLKFLPADEYLALLASVDAGIYGHRRQQGMGNAIPLIALGKKVFLRTDVAQWDLFNQLKLQVFDYQKLSCEELPDEIRLSNMRIAREYFSKETLMGQWEEIFAQSSRS